VPVLVDSSIWIDYFRSGNQSSKLDTLIDENLIATNEIILTELIPFLKIQKQLKVIRLLQEIPLLALNINWQKIIDLQVNCLKKGISGIGIPDLIIAQNAQQNNAHIYTLDKHFHAINKVLHIKLL